MKLIPCAISFLWYAALVAGNGGYVNDGPMKCDQIDLWLGLNQSEVMQIIATCPTGRTNDWLCTQIPLAWCFGNDYGNLIPKRNGSMDGSCYGCEMKGAELTCHCDPGLDILPAGWGLTSIDTNPVLENRDGWLFCFDFQAKRCDGTVNPVESPVTVSFA
ncbi:hypothetical protein F4780DRAFT_784604 [Xylariomycetidae sp. FL0641]|nr:hypothetical protein F4780DRAFT_784604 [Xylariomycetidae sp. FL0641]